MLCFLPLFWYGFGINKASFLLALNSQNSMPSHTRKDWLLGLILGLGILLIAQTGWLRPLEQANYRSSMNSLHKAPSPDLVLVEIDDPSLQALGGYPLSPQWFAQALEHLYAAQPKLIANTVFFSRPSYGEAVQQAQQLVEFYDASQLVNLPHSEIIQQEVHELGKKLHQLQSTLMPENDLAQVMASSDLLVQAIPFELYALQETPAQSALPGLDWMPPGMLRQRLAQQQIRASFAETAPPPRQVALVIPPVAALQAAPVTLAALSPGTFDKSDDPDLAPLVMQFHQDYFPSLPLLLAAKSLGLGVQDIQVTLGSGVQLGDLSINTTPQLQLRPFRYAQDFPRLSFSQVALGEFAPELLRNKIVLIGFTASSYALPLDATAAAVLPPVVQTAQTLSSLLQKDFLNRPAWSTGLEWALLLLVTAWLSLLLPRWDKWRSLALTLAGVLLLAGVQIGAMQLWQLWLPMLLPALLLVLGYLVWWLSRLWLRLLHQAHLSAEGIEANRLLGLAYQGQGRLEQAFEKFSRCPLNDDMLGLLYNLALDFERKRQDKEALAVYRSMAQGTPDYRDIEQRMQRLLQQKPRLSDKPRNSLSDWLEANSELRKPMLGRYQVEKKLGKGAMGVVYLGKDAKMDRMVALKTLALYDEFEGEALQDATRRFFREASAAGRLTHEHIVAVYDAGEEDNLAYIAMEFFKGSNLTPYTRKDNLLPLDTLFDIAIHAAEALEYAHSQGVIHRDIKPANIMYNPGSGKIKLTDFGIAHITDSNKTKTGVILGTPSYMSPEQLSGKEVDGRADLFSLGVSLYQLLTASLPFQAESMASLMFKIAGEPHPALLGKRADLPECMQTLIDTLLHKNPQQRYADGAALAAALRACRDAWIKQQYQTTLPQPLPADPQPATGEAIAP